MKSSVAAAIALALAIAATTASAGVVITQKLATKDRAGTRKTERTVMVQGHKQKVIIEDLEIITDLDAAKLYFLKPSTKQFIQTPFPPPKTIATRMAREGLAVGFKKQDRSPYKANGYSCQDYLGASSVAYVHLGVVACVTSEAPGAKEFTQFQQLLQQKLKGTLLAPGGEIPDGIPVSSITTTAGVAIAVTGGIPPEQIAKLQADLDKKATVTTMNISIIEVKDLPASTFVVPADYIKRQEPQPPQGGGLEKFPRRRPPRPRSTNPAKP